MTPSKRVLTAEEALEKYEQLLGYLPFEHVTPWRDRVHPFLEAHGFFDAPASIKYHLNSRGGLFRHSVGVALNALALNELWFNLPNWKVIYAALLHDVGKLGLIDIAEGKHSPRYVPNQDFMQVQSMGIVDSVKVDQDTGFTCAVVVGGPNVYPFKYGQADGKPGSLPFVDLTINNMLLAAQLVPLPLDVLQAIQMADGHYVQANETLKHKAHPLSYLIHWSDWYQGCIIENGWIKSGPV